EQIYKKVTNWLYRVLCNKSIEEQKYFLEITRLMSEQIKSLEYEDIDKDYYNILYDSWTKIIQKYLGNSIIIPSREQIFQYSDVNCDIIQEPYKGIALDFGIGIINMDLDQQSITCFPGNENCFRSMCENKKTNILSKGSISKNSEIINVKNITKASSVTPYLREKKGNVTIHKKAYITDLEKKISGDWAENVVEKWLDNSENIININRCSSGNIISGNDNEHYDFSYSTIDKPDVKRYLEVKNYSSGCFHLSQYEYEFAIQNKDFYDIALVIRNNIAKDGEYSCEVKLLSSPFADGSDIKITPYPCDYIVRLVFEEEGE
ncbi:MAG: DUF3883 domain-containing protein, partial [Bacteroidales bacterium]|nr:DUF3883 domain-containing protein [Candidatus Sodaliphilus fimicaballi]